MDDPLVVELVRKIIFTLVSVLYNPLSEYCRFGFGDNRLHQFNEMQRLQSILLAVLNNTQEAILQNRYLP